MSEMIETVAMALFERERAKPFVYTTLLLYGDPPCEWDDLADPVKNDFRDQARAAIAAMREPTLDMVLIGHNAEPLPSMRARPIHYKHAWQAMIDEALR